MTDGISRDEFLRLVNRVETIDTGGTRGVAVLAVQVQQIAQELGRHEKQHEREVADRRAARRWLFMAAVAAVAAIDGPIVTVLLALHR